MTKQLIEEQRKLNDGIVETAWARVRPMLELNITDEQRQAILTWYAQTINAVIGH